MTSHPRSSWLTGLIGVGMRAYLARRIRLLSNLQHWKRNSAGIQRSQLRQLLSEAAETEIGRISNYARLATLSDDDMLKGYRDAVPIGDWIAYKDRVARMREHAEPNILWPGLVRDYAQTSGTTAGDKFIPVSKDMLASNFRASLDIFSHMARMGVSLPSLLTGKSLFLGGSTDLSTNSHGVRTGDLSGIVTPLIRWPVSKVYLPGPDIALMSHWPSKIDAMAKACLDQDVRMVSGMCSWALVLFERLIAMAREQGRTVSTIHDVWPNFTIFVHGGVKYAPFDPRVRQAYSGAHDGPDIPFRLELYPASEGFIAIQDTRGDPALRLLTDNHNFFEFVPLEDIARPDAPAFTCDAVEKGQKYVVVLTTCAGLWRYILGDVVEFDTIPSRPDGSGGDGPSRLRIVGRHKHFINAFGENLIVDNIENAVAKAASQTGLIVGEFTAAPVYPGPGRRAGLEIAVEAANASPDRLAAFVPAFDAALKQECVDYGIKRTGDLGMTEPTVTPLALGTFHRWMESRGKLGGQHKCPRCANTRDIIDQVLAFAK